MNTHQASAAAPPAWLHHSEPSFVEVGEDRIAYRRKGAGEPVVFLQGARMTRRWLPFYEALSAEVDLAVPELPGFGDTPLPSWLDGFNDMILHCDELFDALGMGRLHLVGHGLGAWIAAEFAVFYPGRLASLALLSPFGLRYPGYPLRDVFRLLPAEVPEALFSQAGDGYDELLSYGDEDESLIAQIEESITVARLMWNPRYDYKLDTRLRRVRCPALVVGADDDRIVPREHLDRWVELLPRARRATVTGEERPTGHAFIAQQPRSAASLVAAFVKESAT
jgi:pimeloyl-ACP methyl ester carboxylesterase